MISHLIKTRDTSHITRNLVKFKNTPAAVLQPKWVTPEDEQAPYESHQLCRDLMHSILAKDMDVMTESKMVVEEVK